MLLIPSYQFDSTTSSSPFPSLCRGRLDTDPTIMSRVAVATWYLVSWHRDLISYCHSNSILSSMTMHPTRIPKESRRQCYISSNQVLIFVEKVSVTTSKLIALWTSLKSRLLTLPFRWTAITANHHCPWLYPPIEVEKAASSDGASQNVETANHCN